MRLSLIVTMGVLWLREGLIQLLKGVAGKTV